MHRPHSNSLTPSNCGLLRRPYVPYIAHLQAQADSRVDPLLFTLLYLQGCMADDPSSFPIGHIPRVF